MILKGFGWEEPFFKRVSKFMGSLSIYRISTLTYIIAVILLIIGFGYLFDFTQSHPIDYGDVTSVLDGLSDFVLNSVSVNVLLMAMVVAIIGKIIDDFGSHKYLKIRTHLILLAFIVLLKVFLVFGAKFYLEEEFGLGNLIFWVVSSIILFAFWIKVTGYFLASEIQTIRNIISNLSGKDVYTEDGMHMGRVNKVLVDGAHLSAVRVGKTEIPKGDIISDEKIVVVSSKYSKK